MTEYDISSSDISSPELASQGRSRIDWAWSEMPVLRQLLQRFEKEKPLAGLRMAGCLHITTETANLARVLVAGGADLVLCASNPLSTQDDVAAALVRDFGVRVFARRGEDNDTYYRHIHQAIAHHPRITLDDGADLISELHEHFPARLEDILGSTEETTTGVIRLRAMAQDKALRVPVVAVNDAMTKHLFDNRYGTGQSALDGILRATNILLAGRIFTVAGYGWVGRGIARRAQGLGARVIVCEVEPLRALEAAMDGFEVMPLREAAARADFMITATGDKHVIDTPQFEVMKDGCVLANAGHFNVEINIPALQVLAVEQNRPRQHVEEFVLLDGRRIRLLAEGRLVNLAAAEGHPAAVMDMSFSNQALVVEWLAHEGKNLSHEVHAVPDEIDRSVARHKLEALGLQIDSLTPLQQRYLQSWREGT